MPDRPPSPIIQILDAIDQAYDHPAWHGTNLRGSVRRINAKQATWRPGPRRKCIAEIVLHAAYWKYTVRRRLTGLPRASFPLRGSNWFELQRPWNDRAWRACLDLMDDQHRALRDAIEALPASNLSKVPRGSRVTCLTLIHGIALHDVYHTGQIQLLKRLMT